MPHRLNLLSRKLNVRVVTCFQFPGFSREFIFSWFNHQRIHCLAKDFALIRIKNGLFISRADSESQLCLQHNKPKRVVCFFLCACQHRPKVMNFVSFLAWDQYAESRACEGGPIMPAQVANQNTGFTSSCPRALLTI